MSKWVWTILALVAIVVSLFLAFIDRWDIATYFMVQACWLRMIEK